MLLGFTIFMIEVPDQSWITLKSAMSTNRTPLFNGSSPNNWSRITLTKVKMLILGIFTFASTCAEHGEAVDVFVHRYVV